MDISTHISPEGRSLEAPFDHKLGLSSSPDLTSMTFRGALLLGSLSLACSIPLPPPRPRRSQASFRAESKPADSPSQMVGLYLRLSFSDFVFQQSANGGEKEAHRVISCLCQHLGNEGAKAGTSENCESLQTFPGTCSRGALQQVMPGSPCEALRGWGSVLGTGLKHASLEIYLWDPRKVHI